MQKNCLFCRIASGKIPCAKVDESEHFVAFLDINPAFPGHTLIVAREHSADLFQLDAAIGRELIEMMQRVGGAAMKATGADGLNVIQNNGRAAWQQIDHIHWHLIPRTAGDGFEPWRQGTYPSNEAMQEMAARIRSCVHG